jgi:hypothetical protein
MAASPVFIGTPKVWQQALSVANTARDGSGTLADVMTAGSNGSRIDKIRVVASGTTTAGVIRLFLYDGTNTYLFKEIIVAAITPSTSIAAWVGEMTFIDGLVLPATWHLKAATNNAELFKIFAQGGDI